MLEPKENNKPLIICIPEEVSKVSSMLTNSSLKWFSILISTVEKKLQIYIFKSYDFFILQLLNTRGVLWKLEIMVGTSDL